MTKEEYNLNPLKCLCCGKDIPFFSGRLYDTTRKKFCNHSCAAIYNNRGRIKKVKTKKKSIAEKKIETNKDYLESMKTNAKRFYEPSIIKRVLVEEFGHKCMNCGLSKWLDKDIPLELHHEDGDCKNNLITNLKLLCPNCHTFTDNYKSKNKKSTRNRKW